MPAWILVVVRAALATKTALAVYEKLYTVWAFVQAVKKAKPKGDSDV